MKGEFRIKLENCRTRDFDWGNESSIHERKSLKLRFNILNETWKTTSKWTNQCEIFRWDKNLKAISLIDYQSKSRGDQVDGWEMNCESSGVLEHFVNKDCEVPLIDSSNLRFDDYENLRNCVRAFNSGMKSRNHMGESL